MMNTPSTLLNTVKELVESENLINNPALADDLKALLAKHKLLDASRVPPDTLNPKQTLLQVFDEFIHAEVCEGNPTLVHGLRSALRNYVLPNFGFSPFEMKKLDIVLSKLPIEDFKGVEDIFIANTKAALDSKKISKGTLSGYKSCLLRFISWLKQEGLYPTAPESPAVEDKRYAPRLGNGTKQQPFSSLAQDRKGKRCRSDNPYTLSEDELTPKLIKQLDAKPYELSQDDFNLTLLEQFAKKPVDWLPAYGLHHFLTAKEVPKRQDLSLRETTFRTRRKDILRFLGWLKKYKNFDLEDLCLELMTDRDLLEEFVAWGINERGNTYAWAGQYAAAGLNIAKWLHHKRAKKLEYEDIKPVTDLRDYGRDLDHKRRTQGTNIQEEKEEKFLTFEECEQLVAYLKQCCAPRRRYYKPNGHPRGTAGRSDRAIISAWQHYLIVAILVYCGIRQREIRELELGRTLVREPDGYWVKQGAEDHKTGSKTGEGKEFRLPEHLTDDLDEWLNVWRSKMPIKGHNLVFATVGSNGHSDSMGRPFNENSLGHFVTNRVYKATSFLFCKPKRVNPHFFRNLIITHQRTHGDSSQQESLAVMMGQSVETANKIYNLMTPRDKTAKVKNWWKHPST